MLALTDAAIRGSFTNASRREVREATLPDLANVPWDDMHFLGWRDRKKDNTGYVVIDVDQTPVGVRFTTAPRRGPRRRVLCSWCQDIVVEDDVTMYVARRSGPAGRKGDSVGTLICSDFGCNDNVRRRPTLTEVGSGAEEDRIALIERRIDGLRERSDAFIRRVLATG